MSVDEVNTIRQSDFSLQELKDAETYRRARLLKFLGSIVVIVAVTLLCIEGFCRFLLFVDKPALSGNPQYDLKYMVAKTVTPAEDNIVLCGDSLVKQGLYPELIAAKLEKINAHIRVVNLAVDGGSQQDAIDYLKFLKEMRCTKPRLVVYDFEVSSTGGGILLSQSKPRSNSASMPNNVRKSNYLFNRKFKNKLSLLDSILYAPQDISVAIQFRGELKHLVLQFLSVIPNGQLYEILSTRQLCNSSDNSTSYCGMSPDHNLTTPKTAMAQTHGETGNWCLGPQGNHFYYNEHAYDTLVRYCQSEQIPLMLVWLPHQRAIYEKYWYSSPNTESWFETQFNRYSQQLFVFPENINNLPADCNYYSDFRHLSTYGCIKASELLADAIGKLKYRALIERR